MEERTGGIAPSFLALHSEAAMPSISVAAPRPCPRSHRARPAAWAIIASGLAFLAAPARAEFPRFFRGLTAPFRAAHREAPPLPLDPCLERLADEVAWLEHHVNHFGSIVAKEPDVWGQARLTQHRAEYEEQMRRQLGLFESRASAAIRRSDQAFLGMALALQSASGNRRGGDQVAVPSAGSSSNAFTTITGLIPSGNEDTARADSVVIARSRPADFATNPAGAVFGDDDLALEPTLHLDQLSRYLNHLNQLRRINEGDDSADSPGYSLNLVRVPVSIIPGGLTRKGHGAEITFLAEPILGDDLLPTTSRSLVLNDLVDLIAPPLTWAVNDPDCLRWAATITGAEPGDEPRPADSASRRQGVMAAMQALSARLPAVAPSAPPATKTRRARLPIPFSQLADVSGIRQIAILIRDTRAALENDPANRPCIGYLAVRAHIGEELESAWELLALEAQRHVWQELPGWNLATLVRSRDAAQLAGVRCRFFTSLAGPRPAEAAWTLTTPDGLGDPADFADADLCCGQPQPAVPVCQTTTAVLAWGILVESALLDQRLIEDMRTAASVHGGGSLGDCIAGPFYGPDPSPEARAAFAEYVRTRWPVRVFALDPAIEEQNVDESYSRRRELQIAMALAAASGRLNAQALTRYTRRLEMDLATTSLNRTIVGFSHGSDTFGWRFYPRVQSPPTRGTLATVSETLRGGPTTDGDLMQRQLEPGMRECSAIVVMPSFVPTVRLDAQASWFSLAHPQAVVPDARESIRLSRAVDAIRQADACCPACRPAGGVARTADLQRKVDMLERRLPTQALTARVPFENNAGGFELFQTGITDLAPELLGWYGAAGVDPEGGTSLFLVGKGFSVHDTRVIAGGRVVRITPLSRELIQVVIPGGVQTIPATPPGPGGTARRASSPRIRLASATEPLPPPARHTVVASPRAGFVDSCWGDGCGIACNHREMVEIHLATPYGVTGSLLVPVIRGESNGGGMPRFVPGCGFALSFTTAKTAGSEVPNAKVDEFYGSSCESLEISVPESFIPPAKAALRLVLRDESRDVTAATFSFADPFFDGRKNRYVIAGGDLRNFVGDTSRPATDKTLRGAAKPYLDSLLATGGLAEDGDSVALTLSAEIVAGEQAVAVGGSVPVTATRRGKTVIEPTELPAAP
ncbi:MAG: hypothetical protein RLZZ440_383 [Planctomycetota bacterium]